MIKIQWVQYWSNIFLEIEFIKELKEIKIDTKEFAESFGKIIADITGSSFVNQGVNYFYWFENEEKVSNSQSQENIHVNILNNSSKVKTKKVLLPYFVLIEVENTQTGEISKFAYGPFSPKISLGKSVKFVLQYLKRPIDFFKDFSNTDNTVRDEYIETRTLHTTNDMIILEIRRRRQEKIIKSKFLGLRKKENKKSETYSIIVKAKKDQRLTKWFFEKIVTNF